MGICLLWSWLIYDWIWADSFMIKSVIWWFSLLKFEILKIYKFLFYLLYCRLLVGVSHALLSTSVYTIGRRENGHNQPLELTVDKNCPPTATLKNLKQTHWRENIWLKIYIKHFFSSVLLNVALWRYFLTVWHNLSTPCPIWETHCMDIN